LQSKSSALVPRMCWPDEVREAAYRFMDEDIKPATFNIRRNYMRQFFAWAVSEGYIDQNPMDDLKKRKDSGRVESLCEDEVRQLRYFLIGQRSLDYVTTHCCALCSIQEPGRRKPSHCASETSISHRQK
jgi:site-specific recombinase XerC